MVSKKYCTNVRGGGGYKLFLVLGTLFLSVALLGCPNPSTNLNENPSTNPNENPPEIVFNLNGAKALAATESTSRSGISSRSTSDEPLVKILDDGSIASLETNIKGDIKSIIQSPAKNSNEIYVTGDNLRIDSNYNMRVLCIHEDGTWDNIIFNGILGTDNSGKNLELQFDDSGNMYYVANEWTSGENLDVIYKFDPKTRQSTQLTAAVPDTRYQKIQVSGDGEWIFAQGYRNSIYFLRAIPISDAENPINIFYNNVRFTEWEQSDYVAIYSWFFDQKHDALLFSGLNDFRDDNGCYFSRGLFRINKVKGSYSREGIELVLKDEYPDGDHYKRIQFYCINDDGSLCGVNSNYEFIELIDTAGNFTGKILATADTSNYKLSNVTYTKDGFYFINGIMQNGAETGFQNITFFDVNTKNFSNVMENVPNNDKLEIFSYSAGKEDLYFSAARGTSIVSGKIDVKTKQYSTLGVSKKFTSILTLK